MSYCNLIGTIIFLSLAVYVLISIQFDLQSAFLFTIINLALCGRSLVEDLIILCFLKERHSQVIMGWHCCFFVITQAIALWGLSLIYEVTGPLQKLLEFIVWARITYMILVCLSMTACGIAGIILDRDRRQRLGRNNEPPADTDEVLVYLDNNKITTSEGQCAICMCDFENSEAVRLSCSEKHVFHLACMKQWVRNKTTCPNCRASIIPV